MQIDDATFEENIADFIQQLRQCLSAEKRFVSDPIEIICEPQVKWEHLAKMYNILFGSGFTDITFRMTE